MEVGEDLIERVTYEQGSEGHGDVDMCGNWVPQNENSHSEVPSWMRGWRPGEGTRVRVTV